MPHPDGDEPTTERPTTRCPASASIDIRGRRSSSTPAASGSVEFQVVPPVEDASLPFDDASFGVVVSSQAIEHEPSVDAYLAEIVRVLRPGGTYVCATPTEPRARLFPQQRPWNRWHVDEVTQDGLAALVRPTCASRRSSA